MRKLASIQKIATLAPIVGADKIELCLLDGLGWEIVVKRDEFKVGDLVVYCEVDCILPEKPEFEFLRERKFRIRTIRLKKQISQGIVFPLSVLPEKNRKAKVGDDLTEALGITKYDPQLQEEKQLNVSTKKSSKLTKFMMGFAWFRVVYFWFNKKDKGWPSWIIHTDETRIQSTISSLLGNAGKSFYITEKIDGCLHESTIINTNEGSLTIKEICEKKKKLLVDSFNESNEQVERKKIRGFSIKENNNNWFEIEAETGEKIILTGEHLVYLPELRCWRRVDKLDGNEKILLKK